MIRRRVNILTIIILLILVVGWFFYDVSIVYLIPIVLIYSVINVVGSSNIHLNYFIQSHCNSDTKKKEIALTFDDGPHNELTPKLLDILTKYNVKAAFFCIGERVSEHPEIVLDIFKNGHIIGNHTCYHSKFFDLFSSSRMIHEINRTNNDIYKITGKTPVLFRPPYGVTNPMLQKALNSTKMISIGWSLRSFDTVKNAARIMAKLKSNTKPGDIILFHDTVSGTGDIVEDYLVWLQDNDYKVVSLTSLLKIPAYEK